MKTLQEVIQDIRDNLNKSVIDLKALPRTEEETTQIDRLKFDLVELLNSTAVRLSVQEFSELYSSEDYYSSSLDC